MKNFFDCKDEKISEKAFSQSLIISVFSILLCLVVLCSMTYAWFTSETTSNSNTLVSGYFDVKEIKISVARSDDVATVSEIQATEDTEGVWSCNLSTAGKYTVSLILEDGSTAKGHCVVTINGIDKNTAAIIGDNTANREGYPENSSPFTFTIETTEPDTAVKFRAVWGVVVAPDIELDREYSADDWKASTDETTQEPDVLSMFKGIRNRA